MKKPAVTTLALSIVIILISLVLLLLGAGLKAEGTAAYTVNFSQMWVGILAAVVFSLLYGFVRFDRPNSLALAFATAHDLLLTYALTTFLGNFLPAIRQTPVVVTLPVVVLITVAFTYAQTMVLLREIRTVVRSTSRKDVSYQQAADMAVGSSRGLRIQCAAIALVIILAATIAGGTKVMAVAAPLLLALIVSFFSACRLTAHVWAACAMRFKTRKAYK